ncbi:MAG: S9 family peptidase [Burkholderiales bacterium]|nr:S9 family peptidase [Burkholderiales bacterium]
MRATVSAFALLAAVAAGAQQPTYSGHGAASVPAAVVAKYAPPPLEPAVTRPIQAMLDVRAPGLGIVAPDGRRLYFGWRITGTPQVFRLDGPGAFPIQMTGGEDPTGVAGVTPDGRWLVLQRDAGGREDPGLFLQRAGGGPLVTVQSIPKVRTHFQFASEDSQAIYYSANDVAPENFAIYRYDLASGAKTAVFAEKGLWAVADHRGHGDGLRLLLMRIKGPFAREYVEYVPATKARTALLGADEDVEYDAAYAAQDGELLVRTNRFGEFRRLYRWPIGADTAAASFREVLAPAGMDVADFGIDDARRHVYATINDGGYTRLVVLDARTLAVQKLPLPQDAEHVYPGRPTPDGRFVPIGVESGTAPRTSYVWDWQRRRLVQWVVPSAPEVDTATFARARLVHYTARDGTRIPMFVRFPPGCAPDENRQSAPCPVLVEFHGGPEAQALPGFSPYMQLFVDAGFIVAEPNVRGSDGYGRAWLEADNGVKRLDVITDIDDAGRWIRAHWARGGTPPRIGVMGGSYGGYAALVAMSMFAGTYDAGVAVVAISNLQTFLRNTAPYRRALRIAEYGDPDRDAEALARLSPVTNLDRVRAPLLLIQGVNDPRAPVGEAIQMHEALAARGAPSQLILFADEGHGAAKRANQVLQIGHILRFFATNLTDRPQR